MFTVRVKTAGTCNTQLVRGKMFPTTVVLKGFLISDSSPFVDPLHVQTEKTNFRVLADAVGISPGHCVFFFANEQSAFAPT